jgi:hypothetical protein
VTRWFISNVKSHNANNRSANQTATNERTYFAADARLKISKEQTESIADEALTGARQEQVAADHGISQGRVPQIVSREKKRRENAQQRTSAKNRTTTISQGDDCGIKVGDWQKLATQLSDQSVELVWTDPPYHKEALPQYEALAQTAERVLVDGGSLITFCGNGTLPRVLDAMRQTPGLRYYWLCACVHTGKKARMTRSGIVNGFKPLVWFIKGGERFDALQYVDDCIISEPQKDRHKWQQSDLDVKPFIEALTGNGGLVFDPFSGSGTTGCVAKQLGRRWFCCELDEQVAEQARRRIASV